jgi:hypothetical protein
VVDDDLSVPATGVALEVVVNDEVEFRLRELGLGVSVTWVTTVVPEITVVTVRGGLTNPGGGCCVTVVGGDWFEFGMESGLEVGGDGGGGLGEGEEPSSNV